MYSTSLVKRGASLVASGSFRAQQALSAAPTGGSSASAAPSSSQAGSSGVTYASQAQLPRLPVPPLRDTLERYLRSVEPLVTPEEFARTKSAVAEFGKPGGDGERLDRKLREFAKSKTDGSWLEDWWFEMYFTTRDANPNNVNYHFGFRDDAGAKDQAQRVARLVTSTVKFKHMLDTETLTPDTMRDKPIDMSQFPYILSSCRIPYKNRDSIEVYQGSRHIVVAHRNHFYSVEVIHKDGTPATTGEIEASIRALLASAPAERGPAVGALTASERDFFAAAYQRLLPENRQSLDRIQRAILVVCLEEEDPADDHEWSRALQHGDGQNRWFDKIQMIVSPSGHAGLNMEHSSVDGHSLLRYANYIVEDSEKIASGAGAAASKASAVERLSWKLSKENVADIENGCRQIELANREMDIQVLRFTDFGKNSIVKWGMGPDAFAQMGMQLAYYRHFGCFTATYESCTMRPYLHGRTETIRSVTNESVAFCKAFEDSSLSVQQKAQLMHAACERHSEVSRLAASGQGVDRHLLGMRKLAEQEGGEMPSLYRDPAYRWTNTWLLSTSHCGSRNLSMFGFGPVYERCVGSGYMVNNNDIVYNLTSKWLGCRAFAKLLAEALREMRVVAESAGLRAKL